jgi:hypothetical protein
MAMRALYGSTRLTKDVDFDCEDNVSQQSMQTHMDNRSVPRDVYDLSELVRHGADPTELWVSHIPPGVLQRKRAAIMSKIECIDFALAAAELLPYIAPEMRQAIDEARWDEIRLDVAHHVEHWMDEAIARTQLSSESDHAANTDIDLAGR